MNNGRRLATESEVEVELALWQKQWPDLDGQARLQQAYKEGYKDEVCLRCGLTFLAFHHFTTCRADKCPMRSSNKSLLQQWQERQEQEDNVGRPV